jgi:hypothetical protein
MRHIILVLFLTAATALSAPPVVLAAESDNHRREAERLLEDATRKVMHAFKQMLMAIPQYAAPEILENGDIIIRRIHPKPDDKDAAPRSNRPHGGTKI